MPKHDDHDAPDAPDAPTGADDAEAAPTTTAPDAPKPTTADAVAALTDAWHAAVANADPSTGTPTTLDAEAVVTAVRALNNAARTKPLAALAAEANAVDVSTPDGFRVVMATTRLNGIVSAALEAGTVRESVTRDPLEVAAERVALLQVAQATVLAGLPADVPTDDSSAFAASVAALIAGEPTDALTKRLARIMGALGSSGTRNGSGTRRPAGAVASDIVAAFSATDANGDFLLPTGEPIGYGAIARAIGAPSAGATQNALRDGAVDGIRIVTRTDAGNVQTVQVDDRSAVQVHADDDDAETTPTDES